MRTLAFDIETGPAKVYTFSLFKPVIGHTQIIEPSRIICFSAQWVGEDETMFFSEFHDGRNTMLNELHRLLDEADVTITYNGKKFDLPWVIGELITAGYPPVSPAQHIDLYQIIRSNFRYLSNKLDYAVSRLLDDSKVTHSGFQLWVDCMNGDKEGWETMKEYAVKDTALLIPLYEKLKPFIRVQPNQDLVQESDEFICPKCASTRIQKRGFIYTVASKFQRYVCLDCGGWFKDTTRLAASNLRPI